jgi:hypothetical protein
LVVGCWLLVVGCWLLVSAILKKPFLKIVKNGFILLFWAVKSFQVTVNCLLKTVTAN